MEYLAALYYPLHNSLYHSIFLSLYSGNRGASAARLAPLQPYLTQNVLPQHRRLARRSQHLIHGPSPSSLPHRRVRGINTPSFIALQGIQGRELQHTGSCGHSTLGRRARTPRLHRPFLCASVSVAGDRRLLLCLTLPALVEEQVLKLLPARLWCPRREAHIVIRRQISVQVPDKFLKVNSAGPAGP